MDKNINCIDDLNVNRINREDEVIDNEIERYIFKLESLDMIEQTSEKPYLSFQDPTINLYLRKTSDPEELTDDERQFAADNHNLIYKFLRVNRLDIEEWYTVVVPGFLKAVRDYNRNDRAKNYSFHIIANRSMKDCILKEYRARNCDKRVANYCALSLDAEIGDKEGSGDAARIIDFISDKNDCYEEYVFQEAFKAGIEKLSDRQKIIVNLLIDNVTHTEIKKRLELKRREFENDLNFIRKIMTQYLRETEMQTI